VCRGASSFSQVAFVVKLPLSLSLSHYLSLLKHLHVIFEHVDKHRLQIVARYLSTSRWW